MIVHIMEALKSRDGEFEAQEKHPQLFTIWHPTTSGKVTPTVTGRFLLGNPWKLATYRTRIRREVTNSNMSFRSEVSITIMPSRNEVSVPMVASTISIDSIATTVMEIMHIPCKFGLMILLFALCFHPFPDGVDQLYFI
ncbi:hypothetical protein M9H77_23414 [Catharanthus roseus]|uniref:Uncharacterized protein n=1 Tax=Catharanthus roseus TaxID=4058 RepID=A0ACC0ATN9_CATRO|nr:hypothetical protein M9H77_23414 [Catharanthus roseus]